MSTALSLVCATVCRIPAGSDININDLFNEYELVLPIDWEESLIDDPELSMITKTTKDLFLFNFSAGGIWNLSNNDTKHAGGTCWNWESEAIGVDELLYPVSDDLIKMTKKYVPENDSIGEFFFIFEVVYSEYTGWAEDQDVDCEIYDPQTYPSLLMRLFKINTKTK